MWNSKLTLGMLAVIGSMLLGNTAFAATTYYVRTDGGTPTQCTGTTNAAYPGVGNSQPCALNHPVWALGAKGTKSLMIGGDTLVIDDTDHVTGLQAQYKIGYGMPNTVSANCALNWSYDCVMSPVPSGLDATHPTKIVGSSYNSGCNKKPQLWGTDGASQIFNLSKASNVDMQCLELTDHSNCGFRVGSPICSEKWGSVQLSGPWGKNGIYAQGGSNFSFVNMDVHGFANRGLLMGGINGINFAYVNMDGNYQSNWDGDVGETNNVSYNSGAIVLDHVKNRFAGCSEAYPRSSSFNTADYSNCADQNDNPPGYGDGLGMYKTGGNWVITNSEFSHNASDGLDLLYHDDSGSIMIQKSLFEGNDGNQIKTASSNTNIENSIIIGNCDYLSVNKKVKSSTFVACRAGGDAIVWAITKGGNYKILNSSVYSKGNSNVLIVDNAKTCNGTESYTFRNNIYSGNGSSGLYISQLSGACTTPKFDTDYSIINNVSHGTCPSGAHNKCATDPKWVGAISQTADSNVANMYLQPTSPAIGTGLVISGLSTLDYNGVNRGAYWNIGAIQNVSTSTPPVVTQPVVTAPVTPAPTTTTTPVVVSPVVTTPVVVATPPPTTVVTLTPTIKVAPVTTTPTTVTATPTSTWGTVVVKAPTVTTTSTAPTSTTVSTTTVKSNWGTVVSVPTTSSSSTIRFQNGSIKITPSK